LLLKLAFPHSQFLIAFSKYFASFFEPKLQYPEDLIAIQVNVAPILPTHQQLDSPFILSISIIGFSRGISLQVFQVGLL
jgi:hypothetical protein